MVYDSAAFWARADKYVMNTGAPFSPLIITKGHGSYIYDVNGKKMLDFTSGQMSGSLGHSHPEIVEVISKYIATLDHTNSQMVPIEVVDLAESLANLLPGKLEKSFFLSTGSESVEAAVKIAKCATRKFEIISFSASYHGVTQGVASLTHAMGRKHASPIMPGTFAFPAPIAGRSPFRKADGGYDWETEMDFGWAMIDAQSVGSLAAFVFEPILSAGGIIEPPEGYLKRMCFECRRRGMLVIADEAQTGLGRTGYMFGFQRDDIIPDVLALSKSLGCGIALSSVSTTAEIADLAMQGGFMWVTTHQNDPLPAAVGCKVLEIVQRDDAPKLARERGNQLREGLLLLKEKYWCVGELRGRGLLQGMEILSDAVHKAQSSVLGIAVCNKAEEFGLSCQVMPSAISGGLFRFAPPYYGVGRGD